MKSYRKELWFKTPGRRAFLNITSQVEAALKESGIQEGLGGPSWEGDGIEATCQLHIAIDRSP